MSALLQLAERCEKATGPDRELDAEIAEAVGAKHGRETGWCNSENGDYYVIDECAASYTASLDAAMTLVPEGWETSIYIGGENANVQMETPAMRDEWFDEGGGPIDGTAPTPALVLCAAALRAQNEQVTK
jgi:hypothetical protein